MRDRFEMIATAYLVAWKACAVALVVAAVAGGSL